MICLQLFLSFLQIGAFSFGGGYAAMPLIQEQVVTLHGWLTAPEFADLVTISQMTPGPIAINAATFVGTRLAGAPGALAATIGCVLPSCIVAALLARVYLRFRNLDLLQDILRALRPAVIAMIAAAGASILISALWSAGAAPALSRINWRMAAIFLASLLLLLYRRLGPIQVMLLAGAAEVVCQLIMAAWRTLS